MKHTNRIFFLIFIIFSLLLQSCNVNGTGSDLEQTPEPSQTHTYQPTLTPMPTITPSPTPQPAVRIEKGEYALLKGDYEEAITEYQNAFTQAEENDLRATALIGIGQAYYRQGELEKADATFQTIVEVYPLTFQAKLAYYFQGLIYEKMEDYETAISKFVQAAGFEPWLLDFMIYEKLGDLYGVLVDYAGQIAAYERALELYPTDDTDLLALKLGAAYQSSGNNEAAISISLKTYDETDNDYIKANANLIAGEVYMVMGFPEQAYARFQDSVNNFPLSYDSYIALTWLLDEDQPVNELNRGLINYFVGQYGYAIDAFKRYIDSDELHDGTAHYYMAFSYLYTNDIESAMEEWQMIITDHPGDRYWIDAWDERAYTYWVYLNRYESAAQTYIDFVNQVNSAEEAPEFLYRAARIYEQHNELELAAETWARMIIDFPTNSLSIRGLFLAAITYYRMGNIDEALALMQQQLIATESPSLLAAANLWVGKLLDEKGETDAAREYWETASTLDPTGYYSERALELLNGEAPLGDIDLVDLDIDIADERSIAVLWLRSTFGIPEEINLDSLGVLANNPDFQLANAYHSIGMYEEAESHFNTLREFIQADPGNNFKLMEHLLDLGYYRLAILISRNILDLARLDDLGTFRAPDYFNHIRFGLYYDDIVEEASAENGFNPLLIYSVIRQESFFESFAGSSAGAQGLMQIMPATGQEIAGYLGWPEGYESGDLLRPEINIRLGTAYLKRQRDYFGTGNIYMMLAAYNAGPGNVENWMKISGDDPDLFFEIIRFNETRSYIQYIYEVTKIYETLYNLEIN